MERETILIVDDQVEILNSLKRLLRRDYNVLISDNGASALAALEMQKVAVILSDQRMPEMDGVTFLSKAKDLQENAIRLMITGYADIEATVNAVNKAGIHQYISKPFEPDTLKQIIDNAVDTYRLKKKNQHLQQELQEANKQLSQENAALTQQVVKQLDLGNTIGSSPEMLQIFSLVKKVMDTPTTVLISGETGTGKELLAKLIHYNGRRKDHLFVAQNCGAIPDTLLQSELFGHVKGAFTGAIQDKKGLFELAEKGTIFLDEIGDTSPAFQLGLLRVLQEGEIKAVGSTVIKKTDVRVITATNKNLEKEVAEGRFREDLYFRLSVFPIKLPPLRTRNEDIPDLVNFFIKKFSERIGKNIRGMDSKALTLVRQYSFPGNIRELENEIERMVTLADDEQYLGEDLLSAKFITDSRAIPNFTQGNNLKEAVEQLERFLIEKSLKLNKGNILRTAGHLGISRVGLHKMLKRYEIKSSFFKP